jgi:hypothetical protein
MLDFDWSMANDLIDFPLGCLVCRGVLEQIAEQERQ